MNKILIAIDGSENSLRAVEYACRQFSGVQGLRITLLHVLPYPPAPLWDDGHIPSKEEKAERDAAIQRWLHHQKIKAEPIFTRAVEALAKGGIEVQQIEKKIISDSSSIADSILEEGRDGGYQTLIVGRVSRPTAEKFFMGSVTMKILQHGAGIAVCVVE